MLFLLCCYCVWIKNILLQLYISKITLMKIILHILLKTINFIVLCRNKAQVPKLL